MKHTNFQYFFNQKSITAIINVILIIYLINTVLSIAAAFKLSRAYRSGIEADIASGLKYFVIFEQFNIILAVILFAFFLLWIYRTNFYLRKLGVKDLKYSPGWSIGWLLIPIANVFMSYLILKDLYVKSSKALENNTNSIIIAICWFFMIISRIVIHIGISKFNRADPNFILITGIGSFFFIIFIISLLLIVKRMDRAQMKFLEISAK